MEFDKWLLLEEKKGIISFDFDDTLVQNIQYGFGWKAILRQENIDKMRKFATEGYTIIIVTARPETHRATVDEFIKDHKLPVSNVYFTNLALKGPLLKQLGVLVHYDDNEEHIASAKENGVEAIHVPVPSVYKIN